MRIIHLVSPQSAVTDQPIPRRVLKLVCFVYLVHLVCLVEPNKRDKPNNGLLLLAGLFSILLGLALEQIGKMGKGGEGRRSIWLSARCGLTRRVSYLIPLVLIVVTIETQQLPVAPVGWIVVMVVVLVMDRELA